MRHRRKAPRCAQGAGQGKTERGPRPRARWWRDFRMGKLPGTDRRPLEVRALLRESTNSKSGVEAGRGGHRGSQPDVVFGLRALLGGMLSGVVSPGWKQIIAGEFLAHGGPQDAE